MQNKLHRLQRKEGLRTKSSTINKKKTDKKRNTGKCIK